MLAVIKRSRPSRVLPTIASVVDEPIHLKKRNASHLEKLAVTVVDCLETKTAQPSTEKRTLPTPSRTGSVSWAGKMWVFSKADCKEGFLQCELDSESSYLTTFQTPLGWYHNKRIPFGISPAPELFQKKLTNVSKVYQYSQSNHRWHFDHWNQWNHCWGKFQPYINIRGELSAQDNFLFKGQCIIPLNMGDDMKGKQHCAHTGIQSALQCARDVYTGWVCLRRS